jgi:hypothetical protein
MVLEVSSAQDTLNNMKLEHNQRGINDPPGRKAGHHNSDFFTQSVRGSRQFAGCGYSEIRLKTADATPVGGYAYPNAYGAAKMEAQSPAGVAGLIGDRDCCGIRHFLFTCLYLIVAGLSSTY